MICEVLECGSNGSSLTGFSVSRNVIAYVRPFGEEQIDDINVHTTNIHYGMKGKSERKKKLINNAHFSSEKHP